MRSALAVVFVCLSFSAAGYSQTAASAPTSTQPGTPAYASDPKFQAAMGEGKRLAASREPWFAADAYRKANKIAGGKDYTCLNELYNVSLKTGLLKDALTAAAGMEAIASTPLDKSRAEYAHGRALMVQAGEKGKRDVLEAADRDFKAALADDAKNAPAYYLDGQVLAQLGQMEAASKAFKDCVSCVSRKDPSYVRAQHFAADPSLSLKKMAPAFEVTALDGTRFNLDNMGGKVVLIDFWATWCGPCNEELPQVRKIAKEFAGQPLVIISVSWDSDEAKWKAFIDKNEMTWLQYRDADHSLSKAFGVQAIPHYFTIDSDGILTAEILGSGSNVEGKLKKLVAKAVAAKASRENDVAAAQTPGETFPATK